MFLVIVQLAQSMIVNVALLIKASGCHTFDGGLFCQRPSPKHALHVLYIVQALPKRSANDSDGKAPYRLFERRPLSQPFVLPFCQMQVYQID